MKPRDPLFELAEDRTDIMDVAAALKLFRAGRTALRARPFPRADAPTANSTHRSLLGAA